MQPGGSLFITTINKTNLSYALAIVVAEQLLRIVPTGTHDWEKFISPEELERLLESSESLLFLHGEGVFGLQKTNSDFFFFRWFYSSVCPRNDVQPSFWSLELGRQHRHQLRPPRGQRGSRSRGQQLPPRGAHRNHTQLSCSTRRTRNIHIHMHERDTGQEATINEGGTTSIPADCRISQLFNKCFLNVINATRLFFYSNNTTS